MGNRCFRPTADNNEPVYINSLNFSFQQAQKIYNQKNSTKYNIIEQIQKNQNRKGNIKKLFDHLLSHERNIIPAIKYCNKVISQQKKYSNVIISNLFCKKLVKHITLKKSKLNSMNTQQTINKTMASSKNIIKIEFNFRNLLHQLQSYFLDLVTKILVYNNKSNQIKNSISQTLIQYTGAFQEKLTSKKQLKSILDLYLTIIFQKNIQLINKNSYLPFYAYSSLLSKAKTQLFTPDFIQKHFNFILKLFYQLEDCKKSNKSITQSQDFSLFQQCVETIVKQFILFSTQNKKIKDQILNQIMNQQDIQKFQKQKTQKLQKLIKQNLNQNNRQHFMFDWLGLLIKYIGRKFLYQSNMQSYKQLSKDSYFDLPRQYTNSNKILPSIKNINLLQSRLNCIETLKRWFTEELLNIQKTLEYFSQRIFQVLLFNLYNPNGNNQQLSTKSQQVLQYFLQLKPKKLTQILCLLNKKLRKLKNNYPPFEISFNTTYGNNNNHNNHTTSLNYSPRKKSQQIMQQQAIQVLWQNDLSFLLLQSKSGRFDNIILNYEQVQQIYQKISISSKGSNNLIYLIQLAGVSIHYVNLQKQDKQNIVYKYLLSFTNCLEILDQDITIQFLENLITKMKFSFEQIYLKKNFLIYSFLNYNFKKVVRDKNMIWMPIFVMIIVINIIVEKIRKQNSSKLKELNDLLRNIIQKIERQNYSQSQIYLLFQSKQKLLRPKNNKLQELNSSRVKQFQIIQSNVQGLPKSGASIQNSVVESNIQYSAQENNDHEFKSVMAIVQSP